MFTPAPVVAVGSKGFEFNLPSASSSMCMTSTDENLANNFESTRQQNSDAQYLETFVGLLDGARDGYGTLIGPPPMFPLSRLA